MRILYVEDSAIDADLVCRAMARLAAGVEVEVTTTLAQARQRLREPGRYDLVLTDLNLPDGNGVDLVLEIRAQALPLAVVALTGEGDEEVVLAVLKAGADDYLAKSDDYPMRLPVTLRAALQRFRADSRRRAQVLSVLYAEHNPNDIDLTRRHLERHAPHIRLEGVPDAAAVLARLPVRPGLPGGCDLLLLDYRLTGDNGLELLKQLREDRGLDLPVVIVTGQGSEEVAAQAMRLGATDYVVKHDNYLLALPSVLETAYHRVNAAREQAALRRSEERLALVLRGSSDAPWDIDLDSGERYLSPRLWQMLGWDSTPEGVDELLRERLLDAAGQAALRERVASLLHGPRDAFEIELTLRHRDGHDVPLLARGFVSRHAGGRALRVSGTCTDLTERKRAEAEIRELNATLERRVGERTRELEQANRELEAFSYSVSHDLRAPLRAIDGLSALLQREHGTALDAEGQRLLQLLRASTARMDRLIHDLLAFARTARQTPHRGTISVGPLVQHCLDEFRAEISSRGIQVTVAPLPDCSADAGLLRQVFVNLLANAVKYTRHQPRPRIEVGAAGAADAPVFYVLDNGAGFDMKHADQLFTVFKRLHREDEFEGNGIGLAIVERIVQRHGGRVWAQAAPGEGATFYFTLGPGSA